jgi:hypothetical protein
MRVPKKRKMRMPVKVSGKETKTVRTTLNKEESETSSEDYHQFTTEPAYVRVGSGVTKNLGNFESLRVDVSITMPCYPEEIDAVYRDLSEKVSSLLDEEVSKYLSE